MNQNWKYSPVEFLLIGRRLWWAWSNSYEEQKQNLLPASSSGKENGYLTQQASERDQPEVSWSMSLAAAFSPALVTSLFQRGNTQRRSCNHWTYSPHSCRPALKSSHYLNNTECSWRPLGPLIWPAVSGLRRTLWASYKSQNHLCWAHVSRLSDCYRVWNVVRSMASPCALWCTTVFAGQDGSL